MGGILIVEDCADTRRLIERALGGQFALRHADDLATARAALADARPELVLLDIGLPDGDGMALCSELRSDESTRAIPVIFLSARNAVDTKVTAFGLGADDFVDKPFNAAELRARVSARLRRNRSLEKDSAVRVLGPLRIDRDRFKAHRSRTASSTISTSLRTSCACSQRSPRPPAASCRAPSSPACWSATA